MIRFYINTSIYIYNILYIWFIYIKNFFIKTTDIIRDDFIYTENNIISTQLCKEIITMFEKSRDKIPGTTSSGANFKVRNTIGLEITNLDEWKDIYANLCIKLRESLDKYLNTINNKSNNGFLNNKIHDNLEFLTIQVHRYRKNEGLYSWHNDFTYTAEGIRYITFILYLNDVNIGGETEFVCNKINAEAGKVLFFPSTWTYVHRGNMPISDNKYIIVGWLGHI
jgi:hypothetical protein